MRRISANWIFPGLIAFAIIVATLFIRQMVLDTQYERVTSDTELYSTGFAAKLEAHVDVRFGVANLVKTEWERGRIRNLEEFRSEAFAVHDLFDDLQAFNWVNPQGVIEVVTPQAGNEAAQGLDIRSLTVPSVALSESERTGEMQISPPITLAQGGTGFVAYLAMAREGQALGALNIVFRAEPLIQSTLRNTMNESYLIWVRDGDLPLYGSGVPDSDTRFLFSTEIEVGGRSWTVLTLPTETQIAKASSLIDEIVLFSGIIVALVTGLLTNIAASQQRSLKESEGRFAFAMKGANDGLWDWDLATGQTYFSPRWYEMLGYRPDELPSDHDTFLSLLHPEDRPNIKSYPDEMIAQNKEVLESDFRMQHKNGTWVNILSRAFLVRENGKVVRIVGTHVDITESRENEEALRRAQEILREGMEALPVGFAYYGADHRLLEFNHNYPELLSSQTSHLEPGIKFEDLVSEPTAFAAARRGLVGGDLGSRGVASWVYQRTDGRWIETRERTTSSGGFIQVIEDITEVRRHQEQSQQTHKMEAVGQLTGGIAHDFNNLLAVIMGNAELLEEVSGESSAITLAIVHAAQRGAELTQRLLAFSRKQPLSPEVVDLSSLISGMQDLLERTLGETVDIRTVTPDGLWGALADPGQVENAILNLALNARDAMPDGGVLTIECANVHVSQSEEVDGEEFAAGDYAVLSVRDQGTGMSGQVCKHAFEPFFTTKGVGEGSGLGLSMVYGFAQQSGGQARIESVQGQGTTVKLYLPRATIGAVGRAEPLRAEVPKGRGETILVIEDDPAVCKMVQTMLESLGYSVVSAGNIAAARRIVVSAVDIRLVLSDVVLPGAQSGPDFAAELSETRPDLQVIFMSGYPVDDQGEGGVASLDRVLLSKPFTIEQLAQILTHSLAV